MPTAYRMVAMPNTPKRSPWPDAATRHGESRANNLTRSFASANLRNARELVGNDGIAACVVLAGAVLAGAVQPTSDRGRLDGINHDHAD